MKHELLATRNNLALFRRRQDCYVIVGIDATARPVKVYPVAPTEGQEHCSALPLTDDALLLLDPVGFSLKEASERVPALMAKAEQFRLSLEAPPALSTTQHRLVAFEAGLGLWQRADGGAFVTGLNLTANPPIVYPIQGGIPLSDEALRYLAPVAEEAKQAEQRFNRLAEELKRMRDGKDPHDLTSN